MRFVIGLFFFSIAVSSPSWAEECKNPLNSIGACLYWNWEIPPTTSTKGSFIFGFQSLADASKPVETSADAEVILWMPSMSHGSSPVQVEKVSAGIYRATKVFFVMHGSWEIHFLLKKAGQVVDETVVPFTF